MLRIVLSNHFKKDLKLIQKRGYDIALLDKVVNLLALRKKLPDFYKDHKLIGKYEGYRECHIAPDWLLVYKVNASDLILTLMRTGTHSDLF